MLRRENDNSFIKNLYFWLVHVVGDCSNFILCDVLYLSSEKISFLPQTSVKISRKAFYQVVDNDENSSYGTVQYSFCQQKKCLELFWQDMETSLLSCFCRFLKLEWRIKISLKQRLYIISSDFNYHSVLKISPLFQEQIEVFITFVWSDERTELFSFGRFLSKWNDAYFPSWGPFQSRKSL